MIDALESLEFDVNLCSRIIADELRGLLRTVRAINFDKIPRQWALRGTTAGRHPGRQGDGADFGYYDQRSRKRISVRRVQEL